MSETKTSSATKSEAGRAERIRELLAILGDLYQRAGYHQAAGANGSGSTPDYSVYGYRPYDAATAGWMRPAGMAGGMPWPVDPAAYRAGHPHHAPY